jgi:ribosomal protein L11 methyltransferase
VAAVWFECAVDVPIEHGEIVTNFLIELGAPGLQVEERDGIAHLTAYYSAPPPLDALTRFSVSVGCPLHANSIRVRPVPHEDWAENWKEHFPAQALGKQLYICPPWDCAAPAGRLAVVIDPGMAFGTGQHATTRGCLLLLEHALSNHRTVARALDVGTGSGVLAIALAKLGVAEVWAVDTDCTACAIAKANAASNDVAERVHVRHDLDEVPGTIDLLCANLFAPLLQELAPKLADLLTPSGMLICSGFFTYDEDMVSCAYEACGLRVARRLEEQSWVTLALQPTTKR